MAAVWIGHRGSVAKCARSQVRLFHEDAGAAQEHVTEHRKIWESDWSMTVVPHTKTSPDTTSLQWTAHRTSGIETLEPDARRRLRGKTRTASVDQEITQSSSALSHRQCKTHITETAGDHDDKRRRIMNLKHHFRQLLKKKVLNRTQSCLNWRQASMNLLWMCRCQWS